MLCKDTFLANKGHQKIPPAAWEGIPKPRHKASQQKAVIQKIKDKKDDFLLIGNVRKPSDNAENLQSIPIPGTRDHPYQKKNCVKDAYSTVRNKKNHRP